MGERTEGCFSASGGYAIWAIGQLIVTLRRCRVVKGWGWPESSERLECAVGDRREGIAYFRDQLNWHFGVKRILFYIFASKRGSRYSNTSYK